MAFEATAEDVLIVFSNAGIEKPLEECEALVNGLDLAEIENAALYGDDLEEQTSYAHAEIQEQLVRLGHLPPVSGHSPSAG